MTYLAFHFVFLLPVIAVAAWLARKQKRVHPPRAFGGIALLIGIAFFYTTPWDNYLVANNIWSYGEGRVMESLIIGYVPVEEYLFFVLQPMFTGLLLLHFMGRRADRRAAMLEPLRRGKAAAAGVAGFLVLAIVGLLCLVSFPQRFFYLGLILVWACPVLAFQWGYGGGTLWAGRRVLFEAVKVPTVYLWIADMIAIEWGIWIITPATKTGWSLFTLPVEEALFFLLTNLMVVQGLMLFYQWTWSRERKSQKELSIEKSLIIDKLEVY